MTSSVNTTLARLGQYTLRTGIINFIGALTTLICWATMSDNLVFISIFWTIPHFYANSFFAALNARAGLRRRQSMASTCPIMQTPIPKRTAKTASQSTNITSLSLPCYMDWKVKDKDSAGSPDTSPRTSDLSSVTNWNNRPIAIKVETTSGIQS
ncbi:hypothetical protein H0H93_010302 [Arthromyces matolae]|nr:hypothetical protein H0H93_010302 [Arthromyces matolae]